MRFNLRTVSMCLFAGVMAIGGGSAVAAGPRIMALGDSITYGLTYSNGTYFDAPGGYRTSFYDEMTANGLIYKAVGSSTANPSPTLTAAGQTAHNGYGGWTVGADVYDGMNNFVYHIDNWMQTSNPDEVLLLGGINDLLLGASVNKTIGNMDLLLGKIFDAKPTVKVFVSNLLPTTGSRAGYNSTVLEFNTALQDTLVTKYQNLGRNIYLVDQYANFTSAGVPVGTNLPDGLHPSQTGYDLMGATFANAVATYGPTAPPRATPIAIAIGAGSGSLGTNIKGTTTTGDIRYNGTWTGGLNELVAKDGNSTDYGFQWISYEGLAYLNSITAGTVTGDAAAMFPDAAARSYWGSPAGKSINFKFTGLTADIEYVLDFFGGHLGGTDVTRFTATGLNTVTGDLRTGNNLSEILTLSGILPDANGVITVSVTAAPGSSSLFLNAVQLNEVAIPEPASIALLAGGAMMLLRRRKLATL